MIAEAPIAAAEERVGLLDKIAAFVSAARAVAADGLTWTEFGELMVGLLRLVVAVLDTVTTLTGEQKKILEEFARVSGDAAEPTSKSFFEKAKKFF